MQKHNDAEERKDRTPEENILFENVVNRTRLYFTARDRIGKNDSFVVAEALAKPEGKLRQLDLVNCGLTDDELARIIGALATNTSVEEFYVCDSDFASESIQALVDIIAPVGDDNNNNINNKTLRSIHLNGCRIGNDGARLFARALRGNASIETIRLENLHDLTDGAGCMALAEMLQTNACIKEFLFSNMHMVGTKTSEALARALKHNKTLEMLYVVGVPLSTAFVSTLFSEGVKENTALKEIGLIQCNIPDEALVEIARAVGFHPTLEKLFVQGHFANTNAIAEFGNTIKNNKVLETLCLYGTNNNNDDGNDEHCASDATTMFRALSCNNKTLKHLDLSGVCCRGTSAEAMEHALRDNSTLEKLTLDRVNLSKAASVSLARGLAKNTRLSLLSLRRGDYCYRTLAKALKINRTLQRLYADGVNNSSFGSLAQAIKVNTSLCFVELDGGGTVGLRSFVDAVKYNTTLQEFAACSFKETVDGGTGGARRLVHVCRSYLLNEKRRRLQS